MRQVFRARTSADAVDYISKLLVRIPQSHQIKISSLKIREEETHSVQVGLGSDFETEVYDPKLRPTGLQPGPYLSVLVHHFHVSAVASEGLHPCTLR